MNIFSYFKKPLVVATHNGSFHADDVFAVATLSIWAEKNGKRIRVIRTRDPKIIEKADIVLDVGNTYEPSKNRFDHHQKGKAGTHSNGIPYAAFGLIWKHFGKDITDKEILEKVETKLIIPIDAHDNGVNISLSNELKIKDYSFDEAIHALRKATPGKDLRKSFDQAVLFSKTVLKAEIKLARLELEAEREILQIVQAQHEPEVLILEKYMERGNALSQFKNIKFVIFPDRTPGNWDIKTIREDDEDFKSDRILFPIAWRGLRDKPLEQASFITGAIFCHDGGWFAFTNSKESAIAMAKKALEFASANSSA